MKILSYPYDRKNFQLAIVRASRAGEPIVLERVDTEPIVLITLSEFNTYLDPDQQIELLRQKPIDLTTAYTQIESLDGELHVRVMMK